MVSVTPPPSGRESGRGLAITRTVVFFATYALASQAEYTTTVLTLKLWNTTPAVAVFAICWHTLLLFLALWAHWMCTLSDPGRVPLIHDEQVAEDAIRYGFTDCPRCKSVRPRRAHHCSVCKRCILHMDHHCPWIGNCVGLFNQKFFIQYTGYVCITGTTELAITSVVGYEMYQLYNNDASLLLRKYGASWMVASIVLYFLAIVFTMFTFTLFVDQIYNLYRNTSSIDKLKRIPPREQSFIQTLTHVFGSRPSWKWLLPLPMKPHYISKTLSLSDIIALSVFDDTDAVLADRNHEFMGLTDDTTDTPRRRQWLPKCKWRCRKKQNANNT
ncbi:Palmitoyltransferase ZDHHC3 [Babesia sp. Xinjiang]|uniref:Palmitoyltransferase ZDHHC3 n=1 Tax=Babesia sp. Xinjiang TaxID=462227 RepID=UPI000A24B1BA|nr:Palmitoyltransferase ZDHHC3 [Babesia sp. Xinjiang]ORM39850.1 Palmitoyltransferase ZDHHC3 [Babesia sp. Xinjiang]